MLVHGCTSDCFNCKQVVMYSVYCEKKPQVVNWDTAGFNDTVCQCCPHIVQIFTQNQSATDDVLLQLTDDVLDIC